MKWTHITLTCRIMEVYQKELKRGTLIRELMAQVAKKAKALKSVPSVEVFFAIFDGLEGDDYGMYINEF